MEERVSLKRSAPVISLSECIICQESKKDILFSATVQGLRSLKESSEERRKLRDTANTETIDRILNAAETNTAEELKWHKSCYAKYTDKDESGKVLLGLIDELKKSAEQGHILDLKEVWLRYCSLAAEQAIEIPPSFRSRMTTFKEYIAPLNVSGGRRWTPKHVGLGSSLRQATRSKRLVEMFHNAGLSSRYCPRQAHTFNDGRRKQNSDSCKSS
ncbi:hypothetical protein ACROYT_G043887 [Oculina patagonica]